MSNIQRVNDEATLHNAALSAKNKYVCILFSAEWHDSHAAMVELAGEIAEDEDYKMFKFFLLTVDSHPNLLTAFNGLLPEWLRITQVPTFVCLKKGKLYQPRIIDPEPPMVMEMLEDVGQAQDDEFGAFATKTAAAPKQAAANSAPPKSAEDILFERLRKLTKQEPIMLFMKGDPSEPRCGFSRKCVDLLSGEGIKYGTFDILSDNDVRQGLKALYDWQTYPQLYANGHLIGG